GCISSTRRFFPNGKLSRKKWQAAFNEVAAQYQQFAATYRAVGWQETLGSSGTNKAIGAICAAMGLTKGAVTAQALPQVRERMLGGALYDRLGRGSEHDQREAAIFALTQRYGIVAAQAARVHGTALGLFEQVAADWALGADDRLMLGWAARLHEIGLTIAHSQHHVHGAYILANSDIPGFSQQEQRFLAALVRTHRRKVPAAAFDALPERLLTPAMRLAALLRLAVVFHHAGEDRPMPPPELAADGKVLRLRMD